VQAAALTVLIVGFAVLASSALGLAGVLLSVFFVLFGYPVLLEGLWRGQTLGKAALGLRVVTVEGGQIRMREALVRGALDLVDLWGTGGAAAILAVLLSPRNQRLGDLAAGTLVLRERSGIAPPTPVEFTVPPGWEGYAATLDVTGLSPAGYGAARTFLLRAPSLDPATRHRLAGEIATALLPQLRHQPPPGTSAELFLVCVVARYQQRGPATPPGWPAAAPAVPPQDRSGANPAEAPGGSPPSGYPAGQLAPDQTPSPGGPPQQGGAATAPPGVESAPGNSSPDRGGFVAPE
jgi:hypothetical protein